MKKLTKKLMCQLLTTGGITDDAWDCFDEDERALIEDILATRVSYEANTLIYEIIKDREELKLCPFCGSKTAIRYARENEYNYDPVEKKVEGWFVACDASIDDPGCGARSGWGPTPSRAREIWNNRSRKDDRKRKEKRVL